MLIAMVHFLVPVGIVPVNYDLFSFLTKLILEMNLMYSCDELTDRGHITFWYPNMLFPPEITSFRAFYLCFCIKEGGYVRPTMTKLSARFRGPSMSSRM